MLEKKALKYLRLPFYVIHLQTFKPLFLEDFYSSFSEPMSTLSIRSSTPTSRLLALLTLLPLFLAGFAFVLQWRGNGKLNALDDSIGSNAVMENLGTPFSFSPVDAHISTCEKVLGKNYSPSFPYYRDWKFSLEDSQSKVNLRGNYFLRLSYSFIICTAGQY
jgi:hypothetical protein